MRVLNQLRSAPGLAISIDQFRELGPMGIVGRLQSRGLYQLCWTVMDYLHLERKFPNIKKDLLTNWARTLVRDCADHEYEKVTRKISMKVDQLKVYQFMVSFA